MTDGAYDTTDIAVAARFQYDLYRYWRAARGIGALVLGARGYLALPTFRKLAARFSAGVEDGIDGETGEPFAVRALFIRRLLERLDLMTSGADRRLRAADPAAMAAYLELPLAERLRRCMRVWVAGGWWPDATDPRRPLAALRAPAPPRVALGRRHLLLDLLALSPDGQLPVPAPPLVAPARSPHAQRSHAPPGEGATERAALRGPLRWLGLVTLGSSARSGTPHAGGAAIDACQATRALDALRGPEAGADLAEPRGRVIIQPNFEIVAYPPHAAPVMFALDCCAEPRGGERAARYALTRHALAGARRMGWPPGMVAVRLAALAGGALPQNVAATLADWDRQADRLTLRRRVTLLELRDAALLDALLRDGQAAAWVVRRLAPHAALVHEQHNEDVRGWLLRRGELPALVGRVEEPAPDVDDPNSDE